MNLLSRFNHESRHRFSQESERALEEQRLQSEARLREERRAAESAQEAREEEFRREKRDMEKDIRKLCKLIEKLRKKTQEGAHEHPHTLLQHLILVRFAAAPSKQPSDGDSATDAVRAQLQAKEQEVDRLEEKFIEVEERVAELEGEKQQQLDANA